MLTYCVVISQDMHLSQSLNRAWLFVTPCTVAHWVPLSLEFSRQEYWSGFPCHQTQVLCIAGGCFTIRATRETHVKSNHIVHFMYAPHMSVKLGGGESVDYSPEASFLDAQFCTIDLYVCPLPVAHVLFYLKYSWFAVLCQSLLSCRVTQLPTYRHSFLSILFHYDLSLDVEYSSLCYTAGPCCLSIL